MKQLVRRAVEVMILMCSLQACATVQTVNLDIHVKDENGDPVEGALVKGSFHQDQVIDKQMKASHQSVTDSNGVVTLSGREEIYVDLRVNKNGYYNSAKRVGVRDSNNKELAVLFRSKRNPIAMYAKSFKIQPAVFDQEFGYDLVEGDYVTPHGKGKTADLLITIKYDKENFWNYKYYLSIRFSNPEDGLVPFFIEHQESEFKSDYSAPLSGYQNEWGFKRISSKGKPDDTNLDRLRNYYFRVRSFVNERGELESAHYGKIYGEFPEITYYLNPTSNDRNIEFDTTKNLLKELKVEERATAP